MKKGFSRSILLLVVAVLLTGCGFTPSHADEPPAITPLALSPTVGTAATGTATARATASPTTAAPSPTSPAGSADWPTYHQNSARTGYVAGAPDPGQLNRAWSKQLDGAVYAEPLVVGGRVIVATENDSLYALDSGTGNVLWHTHVGTPVPQSTLPCGNIDPLGITGTPVYDPGTGLVLAVAEIQGPAHMLVGLDVTTGTVKVRRSVDISGMDPTVHQQRGALALWQGMVYIPYGGLDGDCGNYRGSVVAARTDGHGSLLSFQVPTPREGGIWTPPGPTLDSNGNLYVAVGNGARTSGNWDHSDSILRLSPTLQLEDGFAPTGWAGENADDADLGSMGPVLLPGGWIYADGKSGKGYLLKADHLGGVGGQVASISLCTAFGGAAVLGSQAFIPCSNGVHAISVSAQGQITPGWQAPGNINGSPIVGGHTVYALDTGGGVLYALNSSTGSTRARVSVGSASRFATPTLVGKTIFVGTYAGITAVNIA